MLIGTILQQLWENTVSTQQTKLLVSLIRLPGRLSQLAREGEVEGNLVSSTGTVSNKA